MHLPFRDSMSVGGIAVAACLLAACSGMGTTGPAAPDVPAALAVPSGNRVAFVLKGSGLLNYECRAKSDTPNAFDWVLVSPDAVLRDQNGAIVGKYYGGPTWEHGDGSKVTGKQVAVAPAPAAGNIPWQLVQATPSPGSGTLNGVTYVQRVATSAGVAPSEPCTSAAAAAKKMVRYSADYYFYKG